MTHRCLSNYEYTKSHIAWYFSFQSCHLISLSSCLSAEDTIQCPIITSSLHLPTGLLLSLWQLARTVLEWPVCPWDVAARDLLIGVWHQVFVWDIPLLFQTLMSSLINYILHATVTQSSKKKKKNSSKMQVFVCKKDKIRFLFNVLSGTFRDSRATKAQHVFQTWSATVNKNGHLCSFQRIKSVSYFLLLADQKTQTMRNVALTLVKVAWVQESCRERFPKWRQAIPPYLKEEMKLWCHVR